MAPSKARAAAHDDKPDVLPPKDKDELAPVKKFHANGKHRPNDPIGGAQAKEASKVAKAASANNTEQSKAAPAAAEAKMLARFIFQRKTLHNYRRVHRLDLPTPSRSAYNRRMLMLSDGPGMSSPTVLLRWGGAAPQTEEDVSTKVLQHFNAASPLEADVIAALIHKLNRDDEEATFRQMNRRVKRVRI